MGLSAERWLAIVQGRASGLGPALWRRLLWCAQGAYWLGYCWKNRGYAAKKGVSNASVPVISIGNLTVGGTGKTPCVEYVARYLRERDLTVCILSRGYGSEAGPNDEALVLEENLPDVPHLQDRDRVAIAATAIMELESEVLLLDDGFQHRRLGRDLDVVLWDATDTVAAKYLLPRGTRREPLAALGRAQVLIVTRSDRVTAAEMTKIEGHLRRYNAYAPIAHAVHAPRGLMNSRAQGELASLRGQRVVAFAGIGNPESFRQLLVELGAEVVDWWVYNDHHAYRKEDVEAILKRVSLSTATMVVTTQKDWVKLRLDEVPGAQGLIPLWALTIEMKLTTNEDLVRQAIDTILPAVDGTVETEQDE